MPLSSATVASGTKVTVFSSDGENFSFAEKSGANGQRDGERKPRTAEVQLLYLSVPQSVAHDDLLSFLPQRRAFVFYSLLKNGGFSFPWTISKTRPLPRKTA
jgi:hypothetical protein